MPGWLFSSGILILIVGQILFAQTSAQGFVKPIADRYPWNSYTTPSSTNAAQSSGAITTTAATSTTTVPTTATTTQPFIPTNGPQVGAGASLPSSPPSSGPRRFVVVWDSLTRQQFWIPREEFYARFQGFIDQTDLPFSSGCPSIRGCGSRGSGIDAYQQRQDLLNQEPIDIRTQSPKKYRNRPWPSQDQDMETASTNNGRISPLYNPHPSYRGRWSDLNSDELTRIRFQSDLDKFLPVRRVKRGAYGQESGYFTSSPSKPYQYFTFHKQAYQYQPILGYFSVQTRIWKPQGQWYWSRHHHHDIQKGFKKPVVSAKETTSIITVPSTTVSSIKESFTQNVSESEVVELVTTAEALPTTSLKVSGGSTTSASTTTRTTKSFPDYVDALSPVEQ